jgi:hypothetical protein
MIGAILSSCLTTGEQDLMVNCRQPPSLPARMTPYPPCIRSEKVLRTWLLLAERASFTRELVFPRTAALGTAAAGWSIFALADRRQIGVAMLPLSVRVTLTAYCSPNEARKPIEVCRCDSPKITMLHLKVWTLLRPGL